MQRVNEIRSMALRRVTPARRIPADRIRYEYGFGFGELYHPYSEVLKCGTAERGGELLAAFYDAFAPVRLAMPVWQALPVQAWRYSKTEMTRRLTTPVPSAHFGWVDKEGKEQARNRAAHLFSLRDSIASKGFIRGGQVIDGVRVGDTMLVLGGQNRVAVLDNLGFLHMPVKNLARKNTPRSLTPEALPLVVSGRLSVSDAEAILQRIVSGVSLEQAKAWGLPFASDF